MNVRFIEVRGSSHIGLRYESRILPLKEPVSLSWLVYEMMCNIDVMISSPFLQAITKKK